MLAEFITPKDVIDGNLKGVIVELENELTIAQAAALYVVGQFKEVLLDALNNATAVLDKVTTFADTLCIRARTRMDCRWFAR